MSLNPKNHRDLKDAGVTFYNCVECDQRISKKTLVFDGGEIIKDDGSVRECVCLYCLKKIEKEDLEEYKAEKRAAPKSTVIPMREHSVKQHYGDFKRKWFQNKEFSLIVWYNEDDSVFGFQLTFKVEDSDYTLTEKDKKQPKINKVDTGTRTPFRNKNPILVGDYNLDMEVLKEGFVSASSDLDKNIVKRVVDAMVETNP